MKKLLLVFLAVCFVPCTVFGATVFNDTTADHKWSTAANWSDGKPDTADAVTVHADVTAIIIDEAATCLSFDTTAATGAVTVSGTGTLSVAGNFTLETGGAWTATGTITITATSTVTTAAVTLASAITINGSGITVTLADALNIGTKALTVTQGTFASGNFAITCGTFADGSSISARTLTLGTSVINCITLSFGLSPTNLTVTANTAAITLSAAAQTYWGGKTWGGTITITGGASNGASFRDSGTFGNLTLTAANVTASAPAFDFRANQTVTGTLTLTSNDIIIRPLISTSQSERGTPRTITVNGAVSATGAWDFQDIVGAGTASPGWDLSAISSSNSGGNSGITFRAANTYYLYVGSSPSLQNYSNVWTTTDGGEGRAAEGLGVFPLTQDTIIVDDYTMDTGGLGFFFHAGSRTGSIDASAVTEALTLCLPRYAFGDIIYSGSGITVATPYSCVVDGRLKNETGGDTLDINVPTTVGASTIEIASVAGTVRLLTNGLTGTSSFTLTKGTFDLNGEILTFGTFLSTNSNTRTLQDSAGGGKIVLNGLTGTLFDTTTATNLTISNAPDIDIGDSDNTLTGNVTFIGSAKTFGDFTVKKHAGNFDCIITGSNTFGAFTLETPDATYNYSDIQFTAGTTTTVSSFAAVGTATYPIAINSATASAHTLTDTAGTNAVQYCSIAYSQAGGGAAWTASNSTDGGNNTGWGFGRKRIFHVIGN